MNKPQVIHIMGASGSGTSTLGRALEARHSYKWLDTDDFFWVSTNPPYTLKRPLDERIAMLTEIMNMHPRCVVSGSLSGWGDVFIPRFELVVWLQAPKDVRLKRLRQRELAEIGERILPGGDMHENHENFLIWAAAYDTSDAILRSFAQHKQWVRGLDCPVMILDGTKLVDELVALVCG